MFKMICVTPERPTKVLGQHPNLMIYEVKGVDDADPGIRYHTKSPPTF
jgi:hypothetical protein